MKTEYIQRWANLLVDYCLEVKPSQTVVIAVDGIAKPLVDACFEAIVLRDAYPLVRVHEVPWKQFLLEHASLWQIEHVSDIELFDAINADARIRIEAMTDTRAFEQIPVERQTTWSKSQEQIRREFRKKRYVLTQFPTQAYASDAEMKLDEYENYVASAMFLDTPDPVAEWRAQRDRQADMITFLNRVRTIRIEAEGTDLKLCVEGRTWLNSDGKRNMPSGEVYSGPIESSANGYLHCSFPVFDAGRKVDGIKLTFKEGRVTKASATEGEDYLQAMLDVDNGSRYLGEVGIGLNNRIERFTGSILYDEKIGGTMHVALGDGYPETGSAATSSIHWDLIIDTRKNGRVTADGRIVMENGVWDVG